MRNLKNILKKINIISDAVEEKSDEILDYLESYKFEIWLVILSVIAFFIHEHLAATLNLGNDEAHYYVWSLHPSAGYLDDAPLVAYCIYFFTHIFGKSELTARLTAIIFSFFDGFLIYYFSYLLFKDKRAAFFAFLFFLCAPIFGLVLSVMILPDTPLLFFYLLFLISFYIAVNKTADNNSGININNNIDKNNKNNKTGNNNKNNNNKNSIKNENNKDNNDNIKTNIKWWLIAGVFLGLSFLSKYTAALIPPSALLYLLFSNKNRYLLKTIYPYFSLVIAIIVFSPVIYWNMEHNFISFKFQLSHGFSSPAPNAVLFFQNWLEQFVAISPFIYIALFFVFIYYIIFIIYNKNIFNESILYALSMSAPILVFFIVNGYSHRILFHWPDIGYLAAFPLAGFFVSSVIKNYENSAKSVKPDNFKLNMFKSFLYLSLFIGFFMSMVLYYQIYYNFIPVAKIISYVDKEHKLHKGGIFKLIPHIPGKAKTANITDDLFGWTASAKYLKMVYSGYKNKYHSLFLLTHHYAISDELVFYGNFKPAFDKKANIYNISGFLNQYDIWQNRSKILGLDGKDAMFVMDNKYMINPVSTYLKYFKSIVFIGRLDIYRKFMPVREFYIYLMKDFHAKYALRHMSKRLY
ncbi:MAG: glycosyltransferase family 39 protein [Candidatus Acididesulfobacter guangdongensis]|uniref:Glycosyltransferase family 39 protein n=1 Tax=Acididesulfobacter guangdongensis TaxID=2597225 RepID=A0A519BHH2_ACIG2|nr:MAG: glycosyltransferase family 39 protein [Candidatus Acididesulfobacter guangdongensis]